MLLTVKEAEMELEIGAKMNPGPWKQHSISAAINARLIAEKIEYMDSDIAYVMGLMHDIGRREGVKAILHIFDGYDYMMSINQPEIARICLTHSFPIKDVNTFFGKYDCTNEQKRFLEEYITNNTYNDYDLLIQLCDAISLPNGACIMEKRFIDVALRHGLPNFTLDKWKAFMNLKVYFDEKCNCDIYSLLPNVVENSYEIRAGLHESLPEYRFVATGLATSEDDWATAFVTGLHVYDENGLAILSEDFMDILNEVKGYPIYYQMIDTMGLHVVDVNFDGYKDVLILNCFHGAHSNSWYDCWLWDAKTSTFIYSKSFAEICNPAIDWDKQYIYSSGGSGADNHDYSIYQYINGEFVISNNLHWNGNNSVESHGDDILTTAGIYVKEEQLVNGNMEIVHDGFLPNKDADALLENYRNEEPWKLDSPRWYMMGGHHADVWLEH